MGLDVDLARRIVASLARNLGQSMTYRTIISDMFGAEENPTAVISEDGVRVYLDALKGMFLVEEVPRLGAPGTRQTPLHCQAQALSR